MFAPASEHEPIRPVRHVLEQFRHCGFLYAGRKCLLLLLSLKFYNHLTVTRSLSLTQNKPLLKHHPKVAFKYLHKYLARSFNIHTRSAILASHYDFLNNRTTIGFMDSICQGVVPLWEEKKEENLYGIGLTYPNNEEGELLLIFTENGSPIFTLAFTIAPGRLLNVPDDQVVFIGRLQGVVDKREAIRYASKSFHDLTPSALLMCAIRGIAVSLNITGIVGVSLQNQVTLRGVPFHATAASSYDEFWVAAGGEKLNEQIYYLPVAQTERAISSIKNNHRSRVKRKRQIKNSLIEQVSLAFNKKCRSSAISGDRHEFNETCSIRYTGLFDRASRLQPEY